jgi:hydrogenase maturation factor HypF (carbamoyltransferase family)
MRQRSPTTLSGRSRNYEEIRRNSSIWAGHPALSGGVAYNRAIREAISAAGLEVVMNREYPLGDGCISFGQVVYGGGARSEGAGSCGAS